LGGEKNPRDPDLGIILDKQSPMGRKKKETEKGIPTAYDFKVETKHPKRGYRITPEGSVRIISS